MVDYSHLNLGYACLNTKLRKKGIFSSRTLRENTIHTKGYDYMYSLADKNLDDLETIIDWNHQNNISLFRMSSEIFPFASHKEYEYSVDSWYDKIEKIGIKAKQNNCRLTFHPGQFNQLSSHRPEVIENTKKCLLHHAEVLGFLGTGKDSIMVIHGGSKNGGKQEALKRLKTNFSSLSSGVRERIVLENCEMCYTVEDLLPVCQELNVPLVLDYHHHNLNPGKKSLESLMPQILHTWERRTIKPKFHVSQSIPGLDKNKDSITTLRKHSDYLEAEQFKSLYFPTCPIDIMLECKMKEDALLKLRSEL